MASNPPSRSHSHGLHESSLAPGPPARRNPFSSTLSRRPQSTASLQQSLTGGGGSHNPLAPSRNASSASGSGAAGPIPSSSSSSAANDILILPPHGSPFPPPLPTMPPLPRDEQQEDRLVEARLIEAFRAASEHVDPAEARATLWSSLQGKVKSLDGDGWMFGEEVGDGEGDGVGG